MGASGWGSVLNRLFRSISVSCGYVGGGCVAAPCDQGLALIVGLSF